MTLNPNIMQAVEQLGYRVTVGDVAAQAGLELNVAQQGLLTLASDSGGHLQVTETGEIAYQFAPNFRTILRNKFWRLQLLEWWQKIWRILFYLIRISFGIVLLVSIGLIFVAITIILISLNSSRDSDNSSGGDSDGGGIIFIPSFDWYWLFYPNYDTPEYQYRRREKPQLNFLEAVFSFLFGDGNPNAKLEEHRWQEIGIVIRNNGGSVAAEQISPYLDKIGEGYSREYEDYMLPVLSRFNGIPEVSPAGQIVYRFPDLQVTATQQHSQPVQPYLQELSWRFSAGSAGQIILSIGLGSLNLIGAVILGNLLAGGTLAAQLGGLVAFVQSIYWVLLGYGTAFLVIPIVRYFWIQWRNRKIDFRNQQRQERAIELSQPSADLQEKIAYARQFATQTVIDGENLAYTTETDLIEQELERKDQIDAEWQHRLNNG